MSELLKLPCQIVIGTTNVSKFHHLWENNKVEVKEFNLKNVEEYSNLNNYFNFPDILIHLAWEGLPNYKDSIHSDQLKYHFSFINKLVSNGIKKVVVTGTCLEYGLQEGCLNEEMLCIPIVPYAIAKLELYYFIKNLHEKYAFSFNWLRLFYMYGEGQNPNSILTQLQIALDNKLTEFNMSEGQQQRDYLPVEKIGAYISNLSLQSKIEGIINCCSGNPITIIDLVNDYLRKKNDRINLNLGYYTYPDYEPFIFFGDTNKLKLALSK